LHILVSSLLYTITIQEDVQCNFLAAHCTILGNALPIIDADDK
jgi:hypothetical protein